MEEGKAAANPREVGIWRAPHRYNRCLETASSHHRFSFTALGAEEAKGALRMLSPWPKPTC